MTSSIPLLFHNHHGWLSKKGTCLRGLAFKGNILLRTNDLCSEFEKVNGEETKFHETLTSLNGFFSVVQMYGDRLFAAVDIARSLPLFYSVQRGKLFLSDDARWVRNAVGDNEPDPEAEKEFQFVGYVTAENTLYTNVKQIRPGQMLIASMENNKLEVTTKYYYRHKHYEYLEEKEVSLIARLDSVLTSIFQRLLIIGVKPIFS